ncbi:protein YgfX [Psychrosphaera sp. F3M07]|uniref:protein YgfX n=1 Tax=Psychrosphaera sp. F3M07 TaxID=2841560 RepID=UPI00352FF795
MDDLVASYRIKVDPHSRYRQYQHVVFVCWYCLAIYHWPYFIPSIIKSTYTVLFLLFVFCVYKQNVLNQTDDEEVFHLSEAGQIEWVKRAISGQLLPISYFWPFCFYLKIINPVSQNTYWKVIFADQLNDESKRRLRRIIKTIKSQ